LGQWFRTGGERAGARPRLTVRSLPLRENVQAVWAQAACSHYGFKAGARAAPAARVRVLTHLERVAKDRATWRV